MFEIQAIQAIALPKKKELFLSTQTNSLLLHPENY